MILRELLVKLGLDVNAQSFAKGELAVEGIKKGLEMVVDVAKEAVRFFVDIAREAVHTADDLDKTSQAVGLTATALQELQYAGSIAGISADDMTMSLRLMSRQMYEAQRGSQMSADLFQKLGVKVTDSNGHLRDADAVFTDVIAGMGKLGSQTEKVAIAQEIFGRSGARMIPLLNEGADGVARLREEAHELGFVMDEQSIKQGAELQDTWERLGTIWEGIRKQIGAKLFPELLKMTKGMLAWVKANREVIKEKLETYLGYVVTAVKALGGALEFLARNGDTVLAVVKGMTVAFVALNIASTAAAAKALLAWTAAAAPFVAIGAAIAGIMLFLDDIRVYRKSLDDPNFKGKSVFGLWANTIKEWQRPNPNDPWWLKAIKELVVYMERALKIADKLDINNRPGAAHQLAPVGTAIGGRTGMVTTIGELGAKPTEALTDRFRPAFVKRADVRGQKAIDETGSYWEGLKATFGFGQYGDYVPPAGGAPSVNISAPVQMNVTTQPGQSNEQISQMVSEQIQSYWDGQMESASAATSTP